MNPSFQPDDEPDVPQPIRFLAKRIDDNHVAGHERHSEILAEHETRLMTAERQLLVVVSDLKKLDERPVEASTLRFTPAMMASLGLLCVSIVGGQYASTWGMREQVAATNAAVAVMNVKMDALKQRNEDYVKLQDERNANMLRAIAEIKASSAMTDLKVTNLRETMLTKR